MLQMGATDTHLRHTQVFVKLIRNEYFMTINRRSIWENLSGAFLFFCRVKFVLLISYMINLWLVPRNGNQANSEYLGDMWRFLCRFVCIDLSGPKRKKIIAT